MLLDDEDLGPGLQLFFKVKVTSTLREVNLRHANKHFRSGFAFYRLKHPQLVFTLNMNPVRLP